MSEHELKCWPMFFRRVVDLSKDWEFRPDDRNYAVGDALLLREWLPDQKRYTGNKILVFVKEIVRDGRFIAMRIEP